MSEIPADTGHRLTHGEKLAMRAALDARNRVIYKDYCKGRPMSELAYLHELTEKQVKDIIWRQKKAYAQGHRQDLETLKANQMAMNAFLKEEALRILEASQQAEVETRSGNAMLHALTGNVVEMPDVITTRTTAGSIAPITAILAIHKDERKIMGADVERLEITTITDEDAEITLRQRMAELADRQLALGDGEIDLSTLDDEQTERLKMLKEVADFKDRKIVEKRITLTPGVRAETASSGIDIPNEEPI
jgi:hypothetical protein